MAYPRARSTNSEMERGMVDGTQKQVNPNRGGDVESGAAAARSQLSMRLYGIAEAPVSVLPDASDILRTAYTVTTENPERVCN